MADLGFADYYEALEVYRELDPASVRIGEPPPPRRGGAPADPATNDASLRVPTALAERLRDTERSPFARAAQRLGAATTSTSSAGGAGGADQPRAGRRPDRRPATTRPWRRALERLSATLDLAVELPGPRATTTEVRRRCARSRWCGSSGSASA